MHSIVVPADEPTAGYVYDLTTVAAVNTELGLTSSIANDAEVASQITACSRIIADLCGRVFALQTVTETFRIGWREHCTALPLARFPVVGTVSLAANDSPLIADTDYDVDTEGGIIWHIHHGHFHGKVVATYTGGYDLPDDAPAGLARACLEFVKAQRYLAGRDPGVRAVMAGENRVDYFDYYQRFGIGGASTGALPSNAEALISPFRRLAV